jgi:hypothetical protein
MLRVIGAPVASRLELRSGLVRPSTSDTAIGRIRYGAYRSMQVVARGTKAHAKHFSSKRPEAGAIHPEEVFSSIMLVLHAVQPEPIFLMAVPEMEWPSYSPVESRRRQ